MIGRMLNRADKLATKLEEGKYAGKKIIAIKVFAHCLLLYFESGSCRFYTKGSQDWGKTGTVYFIKHNISETNTLRKKKIVRDNSELLTWTFEYAFANRLHRLRLAIDYNVFYA